MTKDEYLARFAENTKVTGRFLDTAMQYPCPFCAAPDWAIVKVIEVETILAEEHVCLECGRGAKAIFMRDQGGVSFEFVQTRGDALPEYLPPMRRYCNCADTMAALGEDAKNPDPKAHFQGCEFYK